MQSNNVLLYVRKKSGSLENSRRALFLPISLRYGRAGLHVAPRCTVIVRLPIRPSIVPHILSVPRYCPHMRRVFVKVLTIWTIAVGQKTCHAHSGLRHTGNFLCSFECMHSYLPNLLRARTRKFRKLLILRKNRPKTQNQAHRE